VKPVVTMTNKAILHFLILFGIILSVLTLTINTLRTESSNFLAAAQHKSLGKVNETSGTAASVKFQSVGVIVNKTSEGEEGSTANLTRESLDPVLNYLFVAREELLRNNPLLSLDAINNAGEELFKINMSLARAENESSDIELTPLHRQIEWARLYVLNNNSTQAIRALNGADTQFIIITQNLLPRNGNAQ
jgi:hypothetical protein